MLKPIALVVFVALFGGACNSTPMAGNSAKRQAAEQEAKKPKKKEKKQDDSQEDIPTDVTDIPTNVVPGSDVAVPLPGIDTGGDTGQPTLPPAVQPDEIVDGTEVINDCGRCVERAKVLSAQAGFVADILKTYNLGFYKIDPSRNLCDIHFMANMSDKIVDHEGQNSSFQGQVVMYCPCNCNWASTDPPFGDGPGPFNP